MKHPGHEFIRYRSWHYPGASFPLKCKGCGLQVKSSVWECALFDSRMLGAEPILIICR
jgi:hypothetical protein